MDNIKLSLTIILPGRVMVSKEESLKQLTRTIKNKDGKTVFKKGKPLTEECQVYDFKTNDRTVLSFMSNGRKETVEVFTRKCKPAIQIIHLTQETYDYFTGDYYPKGFKGNWKNLTPLQKVRVHCQQIAEDRGGKLENFEVFE